MKKDIIKSKAKKFIWFFANPHMLLCLGLAWLITNGWSYILLCIGTIFNIVWMQTVASAYLAILWLPLTPEKILTVIIAMFLLKLIFPKDEKTLGILKNMFEKVKIKYQERKDKKNKQEKNKDHKA